MKNTILLYMLIFSNSYLFAQKFEWAKSMGGINPDQVNAIAIDSFENVYTAGYFHIKADFDPSDQFYELSTTGNRGIFISKLDKEGKFVWAKTMGGDNDIAFALCLDKKGDIYTTGWFGNTVDFDPGPDTFNLTSIKYNNVFILKLDSNGNFIWAKGIGGLNGRAITNDPEGNIYVSGYFLGSVDFDPSLDSFYLDSGVNLDVFLLKLDADGNFIWAKSFGGSKQGYGLSIALDNAGNIYTTGSFEGTQDFDPGNNTYHLNSKGHYDIFILKLDPSGNFIWAYSYGNSGDDMGFALDVDSLNNVYATGSFTNALDFNANGVIITMTSAGQEDAYIIKLNDSGNFQWAQSFGGKMTDIARSLSINEPGDIFVTGYFKDTVYFEKNNPNSRLISLGGGDAFILKLNKSGNINWAKNFGGPDFADGFSIGTDKKRNVLVAGNYDGQAEYEPSSGNNILTPAGAGDIFILKLQDELIINIKNIINENYFTVYPNPSDDILNIKISSELIGSPFCITDITGKTILNGRLSNSLNSIDLSPLTEYLYFLNVDGIYKKIFKVEKK